MVNGLFGKRLPARLVALIACGAIGASFIWSALAFRQLLQIPAGPERLISHELFTWISVRASLRSSARFCSIPLASVMILIVTGVGFLIHVYSIALHGRRGRLLPLTSAYLNLFIFMMSVLVLADNYILMFVGWEGVGLCSYLLIGYYFERKSAGDAAKEGLHRQPDRRRRLHSRRLSDLPDLRQLRISVGLRAGERPVRLPLKPVSAFSQCISLLLFVGATGKSAQIPSVRLAARRNGGPHTRQRA